jgi:hypothetical protein
VRWFKPSNDPQFVAMLREIVGQGIGYRFGANAGV